MKLTARNADVALSFEDLGQGSPLILLHGFSLNGEDWQDMGYVRPLLDSGNRLILVDLRGHGGSGKPHDPQAYSEGTEARDVAAVLDLLGITRTNLMGYSRGGRVILEFALLYPDRVGRMVVGGAHPFAQDMSIFRKAVREGMDDWIVILERSGGPLPEPVMARIRANDVKALQAAVADDRRDISAPFANLNKPCLFFVGTDDPLGAEVRRAAAMSPSADLVELLGCNHVTALQRSDLVLPHVLSLLHEV